MSSGRSEVIASDFGHPSLRRSTRKFKLRRFFGNVVTNYPRKTDCAKEREERGGLEGAGIVE